MTTSNDIALLDTNILVYTADTSTKPFHSASKTLVEKGLSGEISLCLAPQVLAEFSERGI